MPRFLLNLRNGTGYVPDEEGTHYPDYAAAREAAIQSARSIISEEVLNGTIDLAGTIEICSPDGAVVGILRFDEAVLLRGVG